MAEKKKTPGKRKQSPKKIETDRTTISQKKKILLTTLQKKAGNVSEACIAANIGRTMFYKYCEDDPEFKQAVADVKESLLDLAETRLVEQINKGNIAATIFYLKTQGKSRGFIEKQEMEHSGDLAPVNLTVEMHPDVAKLIEEEKKKESANSQN